MQMVDVIAEAWRWTGVQPRMLVMQNDFGNVIFIDEDGLYWRICPEELSCVVVATNEEEFVRLKNSEDFLNDWTMHTLVERARSTLALSSADRCYCLKIPAVLGGAYALDNIATIARAELISFSGDIAKQIRDLPDGAQIRLKITN